MQTRETRDKAFIKQARELRVDTHYVLSGGALSMIYETYLSDGLFGAIHTTFKAGYIKGRNAERNAAKRRQKGKV